ncbi:hypothetical protein PIB30_079775, partial [Stylosanthes scabra]|nr:hypothetical protein [Stylosanthes scabra]
KHMESAANIAKSPNFTSRISHCHCIFCFFNVLITSTLFANYLNIKSLQDLTCQTVADMIKGKTPEEILKTFKNSTILSNF